MRKPKHHATIGATTAIAAALALSSTPLLAQQTPPTTTTTDPTPPVSAQPAPSLDVPPPTTETIATPSVPKPVKRTAAKPAPIATRTASRTTTSHIARAASPAVAAKVASVPATAPVIAPAKPAPIVDLNAKPATAPTAHATRNDNNIVMFGGGALALLALGGGAYALARRRRSENDVAYEETYEPETMAPAAEAESMPRHDPIFDEQPAIVAPSAFAWDRQPAAAQASEDGSDRRSGETWVDRAYRGPSPANPSVSLRNRLKRAAFFDKRERDVAAGKAEPVDVDAGLPEAAIEEQAANREPELA